MSLKLILFKSGSCPDIYFYLLLDSRLWFDELLGIWQSCTNSSRWEEVSTTI